MIIPLSEVINEFREFHWRPRLWMVDTLLSEYCYLHCLAMKGERKLYHALPQYLNGLSEIVAMCSHDKMDDVSSIYRKLIFECVGNSIEHKELLLTCAHFGCATAIDCNSAYLTIRCG